MSDARCQMHDVRCTMSDARCQMQDVRCKMSDMICVRTRGSFGAFPRRVIAMSYYLPAFANEQGLSRNDLVKKYFHLGFEYKEMLALLYVHHGETLSLRHLKRLLRKMNLKRREGVPDLATVIGMIENELFGSGNCIGYRQMHQRLRNDYHLQINSFRETVRIALRTLDPEGTERRKSHRLLRRTYRSQGPNYCWHIDGYDKLKPFGFCIHGCIDGYSRRIMWLRVASSNNDPAIVADYFAGCIRMIKGVPRRIRADNGTENVNIEVMQVFLHFGLNDEAAVNNFQYGTSVANQRIEAWWSQLRKSNSDFWITYFKDLRDRGLFDDNDLVQCSSLKFCYQGLIQDELDKVVKHWNTHRIRPYHNQETPPGRPDVLYNLPSLQGTQDYKSCIDLDDATFLAEKLCKKPNAFGCTEEFSDMFKMLMEEHNLQMPNDVVEAEDLYVNLIHLTEASL
ncbi:uncharacterized protein LOC116615414 isoform X1 [Nematostella vectensis]|nr:uncharacterized protein LOC116615414 isoform X1 [Nematostella vectensis]